MRSKMGRAGIWVLATLICGGCSTQHQMSPGEGIKNVGVTDGRPCVANFSVEGGYWAGYTVKGFGEYPNGSKSETFGYLLSKISSVGYLIDASDREAGLIRASYPLTFAKGETTSLNAAVAERGQAGIRVDLTFMTGGMATFSIEEVRREFCAILEGVPQKEVIKPVETSAHKEPIIVEKPAVVEKPEPSVVQTPQPPPLPRLVVVKKANLRADASTKSRIIGTLIKGERLELLGRSGDWYRIKSASGLAGWVFKALVRTID